MSHWVPETRPVSRCPEPSWVNVHLSFAQYWRGHGPQRLYLAPSVPLHPYLHSHCKLCPAASTCDITPRHLFWLAEPAASLSLSLCVWTEGHHPSIVRFHWFEAWLLTSFPHFLETWASVEHKQRSNKSCLCVFQYYCLLSDCFFFFCFFLWFVIFLFYFLMYFFSDQNVHWCSFLKQALSYNENLCAL